MRSLDNSSVSRLFSGVAAVSIATIALPGLAAAQQASPSAVSPPQSTAPDQAAPDAAATEHDIIVTARRRGEESLNVPVVVTAFSGEQLSRIGVSTLSDIGRITPQLSAEQNVGSFGGFNTLRGVTSPTSNTAADPAVLLVVDNIPLSTGSANRLGQFDLGQVEVLKGPQALYFGKNSSGGIISIRSAEPTDQFETLARAEYETVAQELELNAVVSGPLTEALLGRLAAKVLTQDGYFINDAPGVKNRVGPGTKEVGLRGTLIFDPDPSLTVKLKGTYDRVHDDGTYFATQRYFCPSGVPSGPSALPSITDCKADNHMARGDLPPNIAAASNDPLFRDGVPYSQVRQILLSLDVAYKLAPGIALNAITGYYDLDQAYADSIVRGPIPTLDTTGSDRKTTFSQELRLSSDTPDSRFSWMLGGFYQNDELYDTEHVVGYAPATKTFTPRARSFWRIHGTTFSAFAQAGFELVDHLTLSGGARYTDETKRQTSNLSSKFLPEIHFTNVSPEATLSYQPTRNVNVFASYKQGYKSGSFQIGSLTFLAPIANPAVTLIDNSYKAETVHGFEGGVKVALFDRSLRIDTAVYNYLYENLQLSSFDPVQSITRISNATSARVKGAEITITYAPPSLSGLRLFGSVAYNHARYNSFVAACFVGQTIAQGCTIDGPDVGTVPDQQNLSGRPLPRAPDWAGNIGFSFDHDISDKLRIGVNAQGLYQSKNFLGQELTPWGVRPETFLIDAGVSVGATNGAWELAFIGKNLTNKIYPISGFQESGTGNPATTGTTVGAPSDYSGAISRGREFRLRLTVRPNLF